MSPIKSARPLVRAFFCGLAASIIAGAALAQTPAPTQDAPKPSDTPPADKTANSNVITAHVAAPADAVMPGPSADTIKAAKAAGYAVRGKGDKTQFCKSETEIGKRIPDTKCYSADQFAQLQLKNEQERQNLKQMVGSGTSSH